MPPRATAKMTESGLKPVPRKRGDHFRESTARSENVSVPIRNRDPFATKIDVLNASVNPYVATLREALSSGHLPIAHGPDLKTCRGRWRERIAEYHGLSAAPRRLVVEVGCHKGMTLNAMAEKHPDTLFLGLDITFKRVVTSAERAMKAKHRNVYCAMANASSLDLLFAPGEVDGLVLFFPDPWVKKKSQAKNRLVSPQFCERLQSVLKPDGTFWLKTDQKIYFDEASERLAAAQFLPQPPASETDGFLGGDFTSAFEQRFHAQNLPTYGARWRPAAVL